MKTEELKSLIRDVPDFPTKGIMFRDLTTMIKNPEALHVVGEELKKLYAGKGVTKVVGIESRGFIGGSILAFELDAGFVPARKPGKLPSVTIKKAFAKEYGVDTIELHSDAISSDDIVVLHDDFLVVFFAGIFLSQIGEIGDRKCAAFKEICEQFVRVITVAYIPCVFHEFFDSRDAVGAGITRRLALRFHGCISRGFDG